VKDECVESNEIVFAPSPHLFYQSFKPAKVSILQLVVVVECARRFELEGKVVSEFFFMDKLAR